MVRQTKTAFLIKAEKIHGNRYDYSMVEYLSNKHKVKVICKIHGIFEQTPNSHLTGSGCPTCMNKKLTQEVFLFKAKKIHGDKDDYSMVKYINNKKKVKIICPVHGVFEQRPISHLEGSCCGKCSGKYKTTVDYLKECKKIHGDKYDYSMVKYDGVFKKISIICPIHGIFEQMSDKHLRGNGCPVCKESKGERQIRQHLLEHGVKFIPQYKFKECKNKKELSFDFFLPDHNMCIEFDGRQHFMAIDRWGGDKGFKDQLINDKLKNDFCKDNDVNLLRISYKDDLKRKLEDIYKQNKV